MTVSLVLAGSVSLLVIIFLSLGLSFEIVCVESLVSMVSVWCWVRDFWNRDLDCETDKGLEFKILTRRWIPGLYYRS